MTTIEDLSPQDFERTAAWLSNPAINEWLTSDWRGKQVPASLIAVTVRNRRNRLFLVRHNSEAAGLIGLSDIDTVDGVAMLWYALGETRLSGQGVMLEATKQLIHVGFGEMRLKCIYGWTMDDNIASQKVLRRAGFRECGAVRQSANHAGQQRDRIYFDLCPSDIRSIGGPGVLRPCDT